MEWQPIETAPKDGTKFDAWCVNPETGGMGVRFADVQMRGDRSGFGLILHSKEGVHWEYIESCHGIFPPWRITHWMPIPEPPK